MKLSSNERNVHGHAYQCLIIQDTRNCWEIVLQDIYPRPDISMSAFLVWPIIVSTLLITNAYHPSVFIHETIFAMTGKKYGPWVKMRTDKERGGRQFCWEGKFSFFIAFLHFFERKYFSIVLLLTTNLTQTFAIVWQCRRVCKICQFSPLGTIPYTIHG